MLRNELLWDELLLGLSIEHTSVILIHLLLHLTRLVVHWHLLLLCLTVHNLLTLLVTHPARVAVLSTIEVVITASLARPATLFSLLVSSISLLLLSVVKSMIVILELYDSITSGDSNKFVTLLNNLVHFRWFFNFHSLSLGLGDVDVHIFSFFHASSALVSALWVEAFAL